VSRPWGRGPFAVACVLLAVLFLFFSALQYNDPDPARWMAVYGCAGVVSATAAFRPHGAALPAAALAVVTLAWALATFAGVSGRVPLGEVFAAARMIDSNVERVREALGLVMVAGWSATVAVRGRRRGPAG
jgi:hypothetical protein